MILATTLKKLVIRSGRVVKEYLWLPMVMRCGSGGKSVYCFVNKMKLLGISCNPDSWNYCLPSPLCVKHSEHSEYI